jgi:hypothetical protein
MTLPHGLIRDTIDLDFNKVTCISTPLLLVLLGYLSIWKYFGCFALLLFQINQRYFDCFSRVKKELQIIAIVRQLLFFALIVLSRLTIMS